MVIAAPPEKVWEDLRHIGRHVEWMSDAEAIRFQPGPTEGVGTRFETDTKVGPIRLKDTMVVTEWEAARVMGIRHIGVVAGTGRFTLEALPGESTRLTWDEALQFPAWLGGSVGGVAGRPILARLWQHNLDNLRRRFE